MKHDRLILKVLFLVLLTLSFVISLNGCSGGGGGGGGSSSTALTPSGLGWTIPTTDPENVTTLTTGEEISSELISVTVKDNVSRETAVEIANGIGGMIDGELPELNAYYIKFSPPKTGDEISAIVDQLRLNPNIETASAEYIHETTAIFPSTTDIESVALTNDQKWGFTKIKMVEAWQAIRNSGRDLANVTVAVIDTGVDLSHPDLKNNLALELNGYKAWDFGDSDNDVSYDVLSPGLKGGHGTQVSGIIASTINNTGINGVAPTVRIFPLKIYSSVWMKYWASFNKIPEYAVSSAIYYAIKANVDVINLSLGAPYYNRSITPLLNEYKQTLEYKIIKKALDKNIIIVAGAGNDSCKSDRFLPAAMAGVISVGAIETDPIGDPNGIEKRSAWANPENCSYNSGSGSNFSDNPDALWVAAPGTAIYTTDVSSDYKSVSGTSFATPFVSGLAALLKQLNPSLTNTEIAWLIRDNSDDISVTYPDNTTHAWKRINAEKAVKAVLNSLSSSDSWSTITTTNAPAAREYHTAVWTGSEMIVFGGVDGSALSTGSRYNPTTDSWTATTDAGASNARYNHTAIWTGTEAILWGGWNGTNYLNTGGRYNPSTNSLTATSTTGAPSARYYHTAIWTGSEMIIWGGYDGSNYVNSGGRYNPSTDTWTATTTTSAPSVRAAHTAVWIGTQMIVWGGEITSGGTSYNTGGKYNPTTNTWTSTSTTTGAPGARFVHTAVWTGSEMIVWGGKSDSSPSSSLSSGARYNPSTDTWTSMNSATGALPLPRYVHTAVWNGSEIIIWGGTSDGTSVLNSGSKYNPSTNIWTLVSTTNAPSTRANHTAVWTGSEMIVWGGTDGTNRLNTGGRYTP